MIGGLYRELEKYGLTIVVKVIYFWIHDNRSNLGRLEPSRGILISFGLDSGMTSSFSRVESPLHPTQVPLHSMTTGATAVTSPPALCYKQHETLNYQNKVKLVNFRKDECGKVLG